MALDPNPAPPHGEAMLNPMGSIVTRNWLQFFLALWRRGTWTPLRHDPAIFRSTPGMVWTVDVSDLITLSFMRVGRTLFMAFAINNTSVSGTPGAALSIALPPGMSIATTMSAICSIADNGAAGPGVIVALAGAQEISIYTVGYGPWSASVNATSISGQIAMEVNG
jgi:hypothetical protein